MRCKLALIFPAMVVGALLLASCSPTSTPPPTPSTSTASSRPYGNLTIGMDLGQFGSLDPQIGQLIMEIGKSFFDTLLVTDSDNQLQPGLAERWEMSSDGMSHTFLIRKGVKFQDGSDLTGADVKFSIERMMAPESTSFQAPSWRNLVTRVELKDTHTVIIHLKNPSFDPITGLESMAVVVPKRYIEEKGVDYFRSNIVGSGPWKVTKYTPGGSLELEAVDNHWREVPKFRNVTVLHVPDMGTRVAMLKTGELDLAAVMPDFVPALKSAGLRAYSYDVGKQIFMHVFYDIYNPKDWALGDVRVRKALQYGINTKEIADKLFGGYAAPYALYNVSPKAYFFDPNVLKLDPYDPEGAKKLLAEAGYPDGFKTRIYDRAGDAGLNTVNQAVAGYWQKIGVKAETVPIQLATMVTLFRPQQKPEIWNSMYSVYGSGAIGFEKMEIGYHSTLGSGKTTNNTRLDQLIEQVPTMADSPEKKRWALEAAVLAKNEFSIFRIVSVHSILALGSKIGELKGFTAQQISGNTFETITHAK